MLPDLSENRMGANTIERIHRLGKKSANKARPIIIKFYDYNDKLEVFRNFQKLKGTKISVSDDSSQVTLKKGKQFWESARGHRAKGVNVRLVHDKILIDKEVYSGDDENNCRIELAPGAANRSTYE